MIIISDCNKDIVIPAGLGDNAGVVYETAGVKSLNGETGDLKIKTVNGNDMLGEGNIEIKGGVETVNGETGDVKIKTVNGQSLMGEGDVPVDVGVETLNGQKGALTLKTVNGNELTGDGNIEIQAGVSSVNGKTGDVTVYDLGNYAICALQMSDITLSEQDTDVMLYNYGAGYDNGGWSRYMSGDRTVQILLIGTRDGRGYKVPVEIHLMHDNQENAEMHFTIGDYRYVYSQVSNMHWRFTSKTPVNSGGGSDDVIVLDGLTQEERKAVYDKLDKTKVPDAVFIYYNCSSFRTYWSEDRLHFNILRDSYGGMKISDVEIRQDGTLEMNSASYQYNNILTLYNDFHIDDGADFECRYGGSFYEYMRRPFTRPNSYFILFSNGIGDSTKSVFAPVSVIWDKDYDGNDNIPIRIQFIANEKLYTFLLDPNQYNKWLFESAKPITGGGATNALTYKQITNENRQEVYDDVKAHWSDASGYTGNYVYFYQKDKDQIIFDEVKFENNNAYFNSAAINYTSGQVHNPLIRLLCCIVRAEGNVELAENKRVISDINGMRYICSREIKDGGNISFTTNIYGDGYGIYNSTNTGGKDGMFDAQFENGIGGYKGNTPANIFTDGTDVFMAFDVVDNHYVYKKVDNYWAFVSKTKIGGVQSSEVSNIKVLTQTEYDALTAKDPNTMYCIK